MTFRPIASALAMLAAAGLVAGCTKIRDRQGYVMDEGLVASVQPGVDNRDSVMGTLGRPTFIGQFETNDWYYVSRETRNYGFNLPQPVKSTVLRVRFDEAGNVVDVDKRVGVEQIASIDPADAETPTLGRDESFLESIFGNIGTVGAAGQGAGSADAPR